MLVKGRLLLDPDEAPEPGFIRIDRGRIEEVRHGETRDRADAGGPDAIICPAFVDAHLHLPQIESVGADGLELLEWLDRVIFPAEALWGAGASEQMLFTAIRRMVRAGTFSFAGYLTSHAQPAWSACQSLLTSPRLPRLRFAVGRVAMDREAPEPLTREDVERAAMQPRPSVALAQLPRGGRGETGVNPRFAISCSEELLAECGWLASERMDQGKPIVVQTHLAESRPECERVRELFPHAPHYTAVYDEHRLLTPRTLLAHCVHLSGDEWDLIRERESVVVHCPGANTFLKSGLFDLEAAREHGVRLALGSDVAAGPDIAMPRVARAMIEIAKIRAMTVAPGAHVPTPAEAWRMITEGNADAIGWDDTGRIDVDCAADLLVLRVPETWIDEHLIGRILYNWSSDLIESRIVDGKLIDRATI
jgi:guanine deaminase